MIQTLTTRSRVNGFTRNGRSKAPENKPLEKCLEYTRIVHPRLYGLLNAGFIDSEEQKARHCTEIRNLVGHSEFDDEEDGGRGRTYRTHQLKVPLAREIGDLKLLELLADCPEGLTYRATGVDIIGGNGTTARVAGQLLDVENCPYVISADPCLAMVWDAMRQRLPAVWQAGQSMLFDDNVLSFVMGTRGLHHIDADGRIAAACEAYRVLKPGGMIVLIDFEEGSPSARWYSEALDRHTATGHRFDHFTKDGFHELLEDAGFTGVSVNDFYDPFVFHSTTPVEARNALLEHLVGMFGMVNLERKHGEEASEYWDRMDSVLSPYATFSAADVSFEREAVSRFTVCQERPGVWRAEYPRVALCATAFKPFTR